MPPRVGLLGEAVDVTVRGAIDEMTGYVMPLNEIDDAVRRHVLDAYDHRYLNVDVEDYFDLVPTGENIAIRVWERLSEPLGGKLTKVIVSEQWKIGDRNLVLGEGLGVLAECMLFEPATDFVHVRHGAAYLALPRKP